MFIFYINVMSTRVTTFGITTYKNKTNFNTTNHKCNNKVYMLFCVQLIFYFKTYTNVKYSSTDLTGI